MVKSSMAHFPFLGVKDTKVLSSLNEVLPYREFIDQLEVSMLEVLFLYIWILLVGLEF
jgi:hypothetical protein